VEQAFRIFGWEVRDVQTINCRGRITKEIKPSRTASMWHIVMPKLNLVMRLRITPLHLSFYKWRRIDELA